MTDLVKKFSNNVFDRSVINKKEFIEVIEYFIDTVNLMYKNNYDSKIDLLTLITLEEFGIVDGKTTLELLKKELKEEIFEKLISSVNEIKYKNISEIKELKKFHYKTREIIANNELKVNKPTMIDLFSGAGGLSLGLNQAGFKTVLANDIDKSALRTYAFNHYEVLGERIILGDIKCISKNINNFLKEDVDLIIGGPPCQGFSNANRQRLIDDPRNVLYKYFVEIVHEIQPKYIIMENVRGMYKVANQVITDMNSKNTGYDFSYKILNVKDYGIPQNRERLIFIGIRNDIKMSKTISSSEVFKLIETCKEPSVPLIDAINDLKPLKASTKKNFTKGDEESGFIIDKKYSEESSYVKKINRGKQISVIYNHKARYNNDRDIEIFSRMLPGDDSTSSRIEDIMPYHSRNHIFKDKYYKLLPNKYCKAITAHMRFDCNMYIHPYQARGLTPREAARVQSYPDEYFFLGAYTKTYQQIGNSVPPVLGKIIGEQLLRI